MTRYRTCARVGCTAVIDTGRNGRRKYCEDCRKIVRRESWQAAKAKKKTQPPGHVCATKGCGAVVTGRMIYCRECYKERRRMQNRESERRNKGKPKPPPPGPPTSYQSMYALTDDLRLMRELGLHSYGELSTWKRMQESRNAG